VGRSLGVVQSARPPGAPCSMPTRRPSSLLGIPTIGSVDLAGCRPTKGRRSSKTRDRPRWLNRESVDLSSYNDQSWESW
jgi:hypothetical protein